MISTDISHFVRFASAMAGHDKILYALDLEIQPRDFERLCVDLLAREGYRHIEPGGGNKDQGKDAELRFWRGASDERSVVAFQFSLEKKWERKLAGDAIKIASKDSGVVEMVFVTSQKVTGEKKNTLRTEFKTKRKWELVIYDREWLRHRLADFHQDLGKKYLGLDLPPTVCHAVTQIELSGFDEDAAEGIFQHTSPELVRASILETTRKEPSVIGNWERLARAEYLLRNYDGALEAIQKALQLEPQDKLLKLNLGLFRGAILAEKGIRERSRPLLVEAKNIFAYAVEKIKRAGDHYNFANVLVALGEIDEAGKHYARCVELDPKHAQAWKNFGSLFIHQRRPDWGLECFDNALQNNPNLVEAHLSKATALLVCFKDANDRAIECFETAYKLAPELDRKWKYVRYWYSKALLVAGREDEALKHIEIELLLRPGDVQLLNQKAAILSKLRNKNPAYETQAFEFLKFRAHAIPKDYRGLAELIQICKQREQPDEAWQFLDANLACKPYPLSQIAKRAQISIDDFQVGFQNARYYQLFRQRFSLEDHCITLHGYGLTPSSRILTGLDQSLIASFGITAQKLKCFAAKTSAEDLKTIWSGTLISISRLFPIFGSFWLAKEKPHERDQQVALASLGIYYLFDVAVAEAARQFGFLAGSLSISSEEIETAQKWDWHALRAEVGVNLFEHVARDWQMVKLD